MRDEAMAMVANSARQMSGRLAFFRVAFGLGGGNGFSIAGARDLTADFLKGGKVELDWPDDRELGPQRVLKPDAVRLALNMVLLGVGSLPRGGVLSVNFAEMPEGLGIAMTAKGQGAAMKDDMLASLADGVPPDELTAHNVNGYLAARVAQGLGAVIELSNSAGGEVHLAALVPDCLKG